MCYIVPDTIGISEPAEPLMERLLKLFESSEQNPVVIALALILLFTLVLYKKTGKYEKGTLKFGTSCSTDESNLSLEEVRARQQERYAADLAAASEMLGSDDSDSSSE